MKREGDVLLLNATDLVGFLYCRHLTELDRAVAAGILDRPKVWDPLLQVMSERGSIHELEYVEHLARAGLKITRIEETETTDRALAATLAQTEVLLLAAKSSKKHGKEHPPLRPWQLEIPTPGALRDELGCAAEMAA
jgi:hypothetical protein